MDEPEIACRGFIVAGCQSSGTLELVKASLDLIAQRVDEAIDRHLLLSIGSHGNDRRATALCHRVTDVVESYPLSAMSTLAVGVPSSMRTSKLL